MGKLYIVSGDDDVARKRRVQEIVCEITGCEEPENDASLEIVSGDAEESVEAIQIRFLDALRTPPFLADSKKLWLRHFPDLEVFSAEEPSKISIAIMEILSHHSVVQRKKIKHSHLLDLIYLHIIVFNLHLMPHGPLSLLQQTHGHM